MPTKQAIRRAKQDKRAGRSPTTQAGEFIREEMEKIRRGKHGARSPRSRLLPSAFRKHAALVLSFLRRDHVWN
jgi:hypothetical protein